MKAYLHRLGSVFIILALFSFFPTQPIKTGLAVATAQDEARFPGTAPFKGKSVTRADLDETLAVLIGKAGFYQLEDSEGGKDFNAFGQLEPFGRKSYAKITGIPLLRNPNGSLVTELINFQGQQRTRYFFKRDIDGNILVNLHIERDPAKGGAFDKADVPFTGGRDKGTFDILGSGDLVGL